MGNSLQGGSEERLGMHVPHSMTATWCVGQGGGAGVRDGQEELMQVSVLHPRAVGTR